MNYDKMTDNYKSLPLILLTFVLIPVTLNAKKINVNSETGLKEAVHNAKAGDRIIVANGRYELNEPIIIKVQGTEKDPLFIQAANTGAAEISGSAGFQIASGSRYVVIQGFVFTHKSGKFRIETDATHCLITRNIFECVPDGSKGSKPYLNISGDDNEISYNEFRNKKDEGQMISVQGPGGDKMAKHVLISHNYFHDFPNIGLNNCSAIQIGLSGRSMDSAFCVVEYNLFERTEGENEGAICHKSCRNTIRFNTFGERSEECSIRHGNGSRVYGNFFINTTGLRFSGDDHLIFGNYFLNCSKAIVCQNGDGEVKDGSKLTCHDRADRVEVSGNAIIDCKMTYQMPSRENGLGATNIAFKGNLIRGGAPVSVKGLYPGAVWNNNIVWNTTGGDMPGSGFKAMDSKISKPGGFNNQDFPGYPEIPSSNRPLTPDEVGPGAK
jgi:poly(beta-D-mannuronate) lyase